MKTKRILSAILSAVVMTATASAFPTSAAHSDPNGDGIVNVSDATYLMSYLNGQFEPADLDALDFDRNGVISQMDYQSVYWYLTKMWEG